MTATKKVDFFDDLLAVQKALEPIKKSSQAYKYKYADIVALWELVEPILSSHNFVVVSRVKKGYVVTILIHKSGEKLISALKIEGTSPQDKGSEITYYRRYNLMCLLNLVADEEDDDAQGWKKQPQGAKEFANELDKTLETTPDAPESPTIEDDADEDPITQLRMKVDPTGKQSDEENLKTLNELGNCEYKIFPRTIPMADTALRKLLDNSPIEKVKAKAKELGLDSWDKLKEYMATKGVEFDPKKLNKTMAEVILKNLK